MHELPVTQALLELTLERAAEAHAARVTDIHMEMGQLSTYVDDSVQFYWDIVAHGTVAEGAKLHFHRIPLEMECTECAQRFKPDGESFDCPECGSDAVIVAGGDVFRLTGLDIERDAQSSAAQQASMEATP